MAKTFIIQHWYGAPVRADLQSDRMEYKDLKSGNRITDAYTHGGAIANHAEQSEVELEAA